MKTLTKITALLILLISTTSCFVDGLSGIKGNKNVVSENRNITTDFNEIKVQQGIQLFITQDNTTKINVEADENIIELLITEVKEQPTSNEARSKLKIHPNPSEGSFFIELDDSIITWHPEPTMFIFINAINRIIGQTICYRKMINNL